LGAAGQAAVSRQVVWEVWAVDYSEELTPNAVLLRTYREPHPTDPSTLMNYQWETASMTHAYLQGQLRILMIKSRLSRFNINFIEK